MPSKTKCSFCGRTDKDVKILITGLNGYICENCARQAYDIAAAQGCYKSADAEGSPLRLKGAKAS